MFKILKHLVAIAFFTVIAWACYGLLYVMAAQPAATPLTYAASGAPTTRQLQPAGNLPAGSGANVVLQPTDNAHQLQ